jgi:hypothetical protein
MFLEGGQYITLEKEYGKGKKLEQKALVLLTLMRRPDRWTCSPSSSSSPSSPPSLAEKHAKN